RGVFGTPSGESAPRRSRKSSEPFRGAQSSAWRRRLSSAADRMRRQRQRAQQGIRWVLPIPVGEDVLDLLVATGRLTEAEAEGDRHKATLAIAELLHGWACPDFSGDASRESSAAGVSSPGSPARSDEE